MIGPRLPFVYRRLLRISAAGLSALALPIASGCGGENGAEATGESGEVSVDLEGQNDANVAGARAVLRYVDSNRTLITIDGLDAGERGALGPNAARIVQGSCERPGEVAFELRPLEGSSTETEIETGIDRLYKGEYAVQVLFGEAESRVAACGDLPDEAPS